MELTVQQRRQMHRWTAWSCVTRAATEYRGEGPEETSSGRKKKVQGDFLEEATSKLSEIKKKDIASLEEGRKEPSVLGVWSFPAQATVRLLPCLGSCPSSPETVQGALCLTVCVCSAGHTELRPPALPPDVYHLDSKLPQTLN